MWAHTDTWLPKWFGMSNTQCLGKTRCNGSACLIRAVWLQPSKDRIDIYAFALIMYYIASGWVPESFRILTAIAKLPSRWVGSGGCRWLCTSEPQPTSFSDAQTPMFWASFCFWSSGVKEGRREGFAMPYCHCTLPCYVSCIVIMQ